MLMGRCIVLGFVFMAMKMNVRAVITVSMDMDMNTLPHNSQNYINPKSDQDKPDEKFQGAGYPFREGDTRQDDDRTYRKQCHRMPDAPGNSGSDRFPD